VDSIESFLKESTKEELLWACSLEWAQITSCLSAQEREELKENVGSRLPFILSNYFGPSLLDSVRFRQVTLSRLSPDQSSALAKELTGRSFLDHKTDVRNLANLKWSSNSPLVRVFSDVLGTPPLLLPHRGSHKSRQEFVESAGVLPELFDYQEEIVSQAVGKLEEKNVRFLIQLPTGAGKTRVVVEAIIQQYKKVLKEGGCGSVLWLAHSSELLEQAISTFRRVWVAKGDGEVRICRFYGGYEFGSDDAEQSIVFASLQKVGMAGSNNRKLLRNIASSLFAIVVDEAHKATAPTYAAAINILLKECPIALVGATATPGRGVASIRENEKLALFFNNQLIKLDVPESPITWLRTRGVLSKLNRYVVDTGETFFAEKSDDDVLEDFSRSTLSQISRAPERNRIIVELVTDRVRIGDQTIVFSCGLEHSRALCAALAFNGIRASFVDHTKSANARAHIIEAFRAGEIEVLVNFGILSTGFDAPGIQSVVIARPTSSIVLYSQMIGRGLRGPKVGGNEDCNLFDLKDNFGSYGDMDEIYDCFSDYW
jgi:DNA repair protein RadD